MDAEKIMETLFPHAQILSGIFGTGGKGGLLNNLVSSVPQIAQIVPQTAQAVAPGGIPGIVQSVAPGGVPGIINSVAQAPAQIMQPIFGGGQQQQGQYFIDPNTGYIYDAYGNVVGQQPMPSYYPSPYGY
jgi:hypothetical protein